MHQQASIPQIYQNCGPTLVINGVMKTKNTSYKRRRPRSITHDWQTEKETLNTNFQRLHDNSH